MSILSSGSGKYLEMYREKKEEYVFRKKYIEIHNKQSITHANSIKTWIISLRPSSSTFLLFFSILNLFDYQKRLNEKTKR